MHKSNRCFYPWTCWQKLTFDQSFFSKHQFFFIWKLLLKMYHCSSFFFVECCKSFYNLSLLYLTFSTVDDLLGSVSLSNSHRARSNYQSKYQGLQSKSNMFFFVCLFFFYQNDLHVLLKKQNNLQNKLWNNKNLKK